MILKEWLINEKKYTNRSASDVNSRIQRIKRLLNTEVIDKTTESKLNDNKDFLKLSCSVKSQLRIAIRIFLEFKEKNEKYD